MLAPEKFADWMNHHSHTNGLGHVYRYHPRSDAHSIALCTYTLEDLIEACPLLKNQAAQGLVVYGINEKFTSPSTGRTKWTDPSETHPSWRASPRRKSWWVAPPSLDTPCPSGSTTRLMDGKERPSRIGTTAHAVDLGVPRQRQSSSGIVECSFASVNPLSCLMVLYSPQHGLRRPGRLPASPRPPNAAPRERTQ